MQLQDDAGRRKHRGGEGVRTVKDKPLTVELVEDELRITVGISVLTCAFENAPHNRAFADFVDGEGKVKLHVTSEAGFGKDVLRELLCEEEDGATPISDLLNKMIVSAINEGSIYVEDVETYETNEDYIP